MRKLYKVETVYTSYVVAEDQEEARRLALKMQENVLPMIDEARNFIKEVPSHYDITPVWKQLFPYGNNEGKNCEQILEETLDIPLMVEVDEDFGEFIDEFDRDVVTVPDVPVFNYRKKVG